MRIKGFPPSAYKFAKEVAEARNDKQIRKLSKSKNEDIWDTFVEKELEKIEKALTLGYNRQIEKADFDIAASVQRFKEKRKPDFIAELTKTDVGRIKKLTRKQPEDLENDIDKSFLNSATRKALISQNEKHLLMEHVTNDLYGDLGNETKTWANGPNPCPACAAKSGETVSIYGTYSNGSYYAHLHPRCMCKSTYGKEGKESKLGGYVEKFRGAIHKLWNKFYPWA